MATAVSKLKPAIAPGPRGNIAFGSLREVQRDPLKLYTHARHSYGDVVRFRSIFPYYWHLIAHPDDVDYVLRENHQNYHKGFFNQQLGVLIGQGLVTSEGDL